MKHHIAKRRKHDLSLPALRVAFKNQKFGENNEKPAQNTETITPPNVHPIAGEPHPLFYEYRIKPRKHDPL